MLYAKIGLSLLLALALTFPGCAARKEDSARPTVQEKNPRPALTLQQWYRTIVVEPVAIPVEMAKQYPQAARSCQRNTIAGLKAGQMFTLVDHTAPEEPAFPVLLVRSKITDMRLTSTISRLWAGSAAASSYINMDVQLVDAETRKVVHEKQLSTISAVPAPTPTASSGPAKSAEKDISEAMGALVAEYVVGVMPAKKP
ncbi:MAG: hypothetical protein Q4G66_01760 [bacterium]|nr:hypothetical protein [bacterium]